MDKNYGYGEISITISCPIEPTPEEKKEAEAQALQARENEIKSALEDYNEKIRILMNELHEIRHKIKDLSN